MSGFRYVLHGVRISSDIYLPDLQAGCSELDPQVSIKLSAVPCQLRNATCRQHHSQTDGDQLLFCVPGVARYLVTGGKDIAVHAEVGADPETVIVFLLGTAWAACCHQRGLLIMHASVALVAGESIAFVGPSGAGKSTLAALLASRGYSIASDDTCVLTSDGTGAVWINPGYPRLKLWSDGLSVLPAQAARAQPAFQPGKFKLSLEDHWLNTPLALNHILQLADDRHGASPGFEPLSGLRSVRVMTDNTFRPRLVRLLGRQRENFEVSSAIAKAIDVQRWIRPWGSTRHSEMIDMLERWVAMRASQVESPLNLCS